MKFLSKIRIIPITLVASALLLSFKVGEILDWFQNGHGVIHWSAASAQDKKSEQDNKTQKSEQEKASQQKKTTGETENKDTKGKSSEASGKKSEDNPDNDPTLFTQSEIDLLQSLSDRREYIEKVAQQISLREGLLVAAEKRIGTRINELKQLEQTIKGLIKAHDDQQEAKMNSLVKIYEAMKPKDAARIFEELDLNTLLMVAERMKERRLAPVMAQMNPAKAKDITVKLSKLRELPLPGTMFVR